MHSPPLPAGGPPTGLKNRLLAEGIVSFTAIARGLGVSTCSLHRWRQIGVSGQRLEAVKVGGRWMSSWEAADRHITALSRTKSGAASAEPTTSHRDASLARELDAEGL